MILMTAEEVAAEFPVSLRMVQHWGQVGTLRRHREERKPGQTGSEPYRYERAQVKRQVERMRPRDRRGGRPSPSPATRPLAPAPDPTSPPSPGLR